jgi:OFA family oxalate/formate antiporter-like MFS transporter
MIARPTLGGVILCFLLGSVHAYSTLIESVEASTGASRASVSLVYSTATVSLVLGVLMAPLLLRRVRIEHLALASGLVAACGLLIASSAAYVPLLAGFGIVFGLANGVGYAISVRAASAATPGRAAFDLGLVSAAYCGGAMVFAQVHGWFATPERWPTGLLVLAALLVVGSFAAMFLLRTPLANPSEALPPSPVSRGDVPRVALLWVLYFFAMFACLMIFGHAAAIVSAVGGSPGLAAAGAMLVGAGSLVGSVVAGYFGDRLSPRRILLVSFVAAGIALIALWQVAAAVPVLIGLSIVGLAYGAVIAILPAHIQMVFAQSVAFSAFSLIFLGWGVAGFLGPWVAGSVFDATGAYRLAFLAALASLGAATLLALLLRRRGGRASNGGQQPVLGPLN